MSLIPKRCVIPTGETPERGSKLKSDAIAEIFLFEMSNAAGLRGTVFKESGAGFADLGSRHAGYRGATKKKKLYYNKQSNQRARKTRPAPVPRSRLDARPAVALCPALLSVFTAQTAV